VTTAYRLHDGRDAAGAGHVVSVGRPKKKRVNGTLKQVRALRTTALLLKARSDASNEDLEPIFDLEAEPFTQLHITSSFEISQTPRSRLDAIR